MSDWVSCSTFPGSSGFSAGVCSALGGSKQAILELLTQGGGGCTSASFLFPSVWLPHALLT